MSTTDSPTTSSESPTPTTESPTPTPKNPRLSSDEARRIIHDFEKNCLKDYGNSDLFERPKQSHHKYHMVKSVESISDNSYESHCPNAAQHDRRRSDIINYCPLADVNVFHFQTANDSGHLRHSIYFSGNRNMMLNYKGALWPHCEMYSEEILRKCERVASREPDNYQIIIGANKYAAVIAYGLMTLICKTKHPTLFKNRDICMFTPINFQALDAREPDHEDPAPSSWMRVFGKKNRSKGGRKKKSCGRAHSKSCKLEKHF